MLLVEILYGISFTFSKASKKRIGVSNHEKKFLTKKKCKSAITEK